MSDLVNKAIVFATEKHDGQYRKFSGVPYIVHPMEVAAIIASMTPDEHIIAAGLLHDTVEDCGVQPEEIRREFGSRVYALVMGETEDKLDNRPAAETWEERKQDSLLALRYTKDTDLRYLWMADKLSNMRSFYREFLLSGDAIWLRLHQKDKKKQEWYYRTIAEYLKPLSRTAAYMEYVGLLDKVFGGTEK